MSKIVCIIHSEEENNKDEAKPLNEYLFKRIQEAKCAVLHQSNTKYAAVVQRLPRVLDSNSHGYHYQCYKRFTNFIYKKKPKPCDNHETKETKNDQAKINSHDSSDEIANTSKTCETDGSEVTPTNSLVKLNTHGKQSCQFCSKQSIKVNGIRQKLLEHEGNVYHSVCKKRTSLKDERSCQTSSSVKKTWHDRRNVHNLAFNELVSYLKEKVLKNEEILVLSKLYSMYVDILVENGFEDAKESGFLEHHLKEKILNHFNTQITITSVLKKGLVVFKTGMDMIESVRAQLILEEEAENPTVAVEKAAFLLRKSILEMEKKDYEDYITPSTLLKDDIRVPEMLKKFILALFCGPTFRTSKAEYTPRMKAIESDIIFSVSNAKIVPSKHVALGLGLKTMTGSKKVLRILNKFGHTINYWMAEEIETNMAEGISEMNATPDGILKSPTVPTFVAFDNYDENSETLSGKDTLHETVGICFQTKQNHCIETNQDNVTSSSEKQSLTRKAKKRSLTLQFRELEPYCKKPKLTRVDFGGNFPKKPLSFIDAEMRDNIWTFSHLVLKDIPMWIGFNAKTVQDERQEQTVCYIKNYDESSTDPAMVHETLKITEKIAFECEQKYGVVTYDLAIAKPAMQIQSLESPKFNNIFIMFGAFHLFMAFFSALGKIVSESGLSHILCESGVLAENSVNGIISGRHFNRCKRMHTLFALALKLQHIQCYKSQSAVKIPPRLEDFLLDFYKNPEQFETTEWPSDVKQFLAEYEKFCDRTRKGDIGATAQFWITYIDLVFLYLKMSRAVRLNDIDLFTYCLPMMTSIFFVTNHQNYARWMVWYHEKLMTLDSNYPGLKDDLKEGGLSVKRSQIPFAGAPVDQTLEHTVNRDAASRLTGISSFTNQPAALARWTITRSLRSEIVTKLKEMAGLDEKDDVSSELKKSRISRDNSDLKAISEVIESSANPFHPSLNSRILHNIGSAKSVSAKTQEYLLNVVKKGEEMRDEFIRECKENADRFEAPIKKHPIANFETEGIKIKVTSKENKVKELGLTCGVFGRVCYLAMENKVEMKKLLEYSLTPVPLSLVHIDGSMMKTDKSALLRAIEKEVVNHEPPKHRTTDIIDGMYFLHNLPSNLPETYGSLSSCILSKICSSKASRIDVIFDCYNNNSIKDSERRSRAATVYERNYVIQGPQQKRPKDFRKELTNTEFKRAFTEFLAKDWLDSRHANLIQDKTIFVTLKETCFEITNEFKEKVDELTCTHEEADSRIVYHLDNVLLSKLTDQLNELKEDIVIRTGDTDVMIIVLSFLNRSNYISSNLQVYLDFGSGKTRRFINVTATSISLGPEVCKALPGLHCFTGCDYTASFSRKGKVKPLTILKKSKTFQDAFGSLGRTSEVSSAVRKSIEKFLCETYGWKNLENINDVRYEMFLKCYKPKQDNPFDNIQNLDPSLLPPCKTVVENKIKRCNYICRLWNHADESDPLKNMKPEEHGWKFDDAKSLLVPEWNTQPHLPSSISEIEDVIYHQDENEEDHLTYDHEYDEDDLEFDEDN